MRGRWLPLSVPRRIVTDLMRFAITIPTVPVERVMELSAVMAARAACAERPPWVAILAKAYGLTAEEFPELRRTLAATSLIFSIFCTGRGRPKPFSGSIGTSLPRSSISGVKTLKSL